MNIDAAKEIVDSAIRARKLVRVDYVRKDGQRTQRLMEPIDVGVGSRSVTGEIKFWGWCTDHDRIEQRTIANIVDIQITPYTYDPSVHRNVYKSKTDKPRTGASMEW
jgi:predicted DNA-binding transcriptional regulator YafY